MGDNDKIYVDTGRPSTLNSGGISTDYLTFQEASIAWHKLTFEQRQRATIRLLGGPAYVRLRLNSFTAGRSPEA